MPDNDDTKLWTIKHYMEHTSLSRSTVKRMIKRGELEIVKMGRATRIVMASAIADVQKRRQPDIAQRIAMFNDDICGSGKTPPMLWVIQKLFPGMSATIYGRPEVMSGLTAQGCGDATTC